MGRSTARAGPSQTQSQRPTQTQRARGGRSQVQEVPEEEEEEQDEEEDGDAMELDGNAGTRAVRSSSFRFKFIKPCIIVWQAQSHVSVFERV